MPEKRILISVTLCVGASLVTAEQKEEIDLKKYKIYIINHGNVVNYIK